MYSESRGELQIFMAIKKKKRQSEEINLPVMFLCFPGHYLSLNCLLCLGHKSATDQILFSPIIFLMPCWHTDFAVCLEQCICV